MNFTTNNTEILITTVGENAKGGLPPLTCHTDLKECCRGSDNNSMGSLGQWTYSDGSVVMNNISIDPMAAEGQQVYIDRDAAQSINLNRREGNNSLSPTGSYCCTVPTTGGYMTLCATLGE